MQAFASPCPCLFRVHTGKPCVVPAISGTPVERQAPRVTPSRSTSFSTPKATMAGTLPSGVTRSSAPFLASDMVTISDPDLIRTISSRSDIGRPATTKLPLFFNFYFYATKFYYPEGDSWAPALQTDGKNEQPERREYAIQSLASGFTEDQVNRLQAMINSDDDEPTISMKCAKLVAEVILPLKEGEELPDEVAKASFETLTEISDAFNPFKYLRGRKARATAEEYVRKLMPDEKYPGDVVHNLGAAAQGFGSAVCLLQKMGNEEVVECLSKDPMIKGVIRVPLVPTTLDGMFSDDNPLLPDKTLIVMDIGTAVKETLDGRFLFGVGTDHRQCPFKNLFLSTANEIRDRKLSNQ